MSLILNLDTAVQTASVCLARDINILEVRINPSQKDHAAWMHVAIEEILQTAEINIHDIKAVAFSAGPGSYTGLRVGMAAAKGLCYALKIPLISINTLKIMAFAGRKASRGLLSPMIDARRMEVFTAVYDQELNALMTPTNLILDENSYSELLEEHEISFFGNGSTKFQTLVRHPHALFTSVVSTAAHMVSLSYEQFSLRNFTELAYSEPFYGKDFYSTFK